MCIGSVCAVCIGSVCSVHWECVCSVYWECVLYMCVVIVLEYYSSLCIVYKNL